MKILFLNGPNLNMLGTREPGVYGSETLGDINAWLKERLEPLLIEPVFFQSNHEGELVEAIQLSKEDYDGVVLNAGAFTHYSYSIRDAIAASGADVVEVHLSNIHAREEFRKESVISPVCKGTIFGMGKIGYYLAALSFLEKRSS
jgi:3-dehydroquinate dehydratase-2